MQEKYWRWREKNGAEATPSFAVHDSLQTKARGRDEKKTHKESEHGKYEWTEGTCGLSNTLIA